MELLLDKRNMVFIEYEYRYAAFIVHHKFRWIVAIWICIESILRYEKVSPREHHIFNEQMLLLQYRIITTYRRYRNIGRFSLQKSASIYLLFILYVMPNFIFILFR